jgi:BlaI family transcriptional regulator, penicillinase repressor
MTDEDLSRRERQIMDVLFANKEATAAEVQAQLADPPSYSTVRALLRRLLEKDKVSFVQDGPRYVYRPRMAPDRARRSAFRRMVDTFFGGSTREAVVNLLGSEGRSLTQEDIAAIERTLSELKRTEGRKSRGRG